jgi:hypothetical protein
MADDFDILSSFGVAIPSARIVEKRTVVQPTDRECNLCVNDRLIRDKASRLADERRREAADSADSRSRRAADEADALAAFEDSKRKRALLYDENRRLAASRAQSQHQYDQSQMNSSALSLNIGNAGLVPESVRKRMEARTRLQSAVAPQIAADVRGAAKAAAEDAMAASGGVTPGRQLFVNEDEYLQHRNAYRRDLEEQMRQKQEGIRAARASALEEERRAVDSALSAEASAREAQRLRDGAQRSELRSVLDKQIHDPNRRQIPARQDMDAFMTPSAKIAELAAAGAASADRHARAHAVRDDLDRQIAAKRQMLAQARDKDEWTRLNSDVIELQRLLECSNCHRALPPAQFGLNIPQKVYVRSPQKERPQSATPSRQ